MVMTLTQQADGTYHELSGTKGNPPANMDNVMRPRQYRQPCARPLGMDGLRSNIPEPDTLLTPIQAGLNSHHWTSAGATMNAMNSQAKDEVIKG